MKSEGVLENGSKIELDVLEEWDQSVDISGILKDEAEGRWIIINVVTELCA